MLSCSPSPENMEQVVEDALQHGGPVKVPLPGHQDLRLVRVTCMRSVVTCHVSRVTCHGHTHQKHSLLECEVCCWHRCESCTNQGSPAASALCKYRRMCTQPPAVLPPAHLVSMPAMSHRWRSSLVPRSPPAPARLVPEMSSERRQGRETTSLSMKRTGLLNWPRDSLHCEISRCCRSTSLHSVCRESSTSEITVFKIAYFTYLHSYSDLPCTLWRVSETSLRRQSNQPKSPIPSL